MEPLTMFASTVGFIATFHLLNTAVERLGKRENRENRQNQREDWYCFFQTADLLGTDSTESQQPAISDAEQLEQRRRQQANRPRLQA